MAERDRLDEQRAADRRIALLALQAAENEGHSDCLTDDELACFVDGQSTAQEQERCYSHLASCPVCYDSWLHLCEIVHLKTSSRNKSTIVHLLQPKQLAWAGTFLAAAASVVLFVNLTRNVPPSVLHEQVNSGMRFKVSSLPQESPAPLPEAAARKQESASDVFDQKMDMMEAAPVAPLPVQAKKIMPAKTMKQKRGTSFDAVYGKTDSLGVKSEEQSLESWFYGMKQGCLTGKSDPEFWQKKYEQGTLFLQSTGPAETKNIRELLVLVVQLQQAKESAPDICRHIVKIIQEPASR